MALPSFVDWGGPYLGCKGHIEGRAPATAAGRTALASLYTALVSNTCLDLLDSREDLIIEGHFAENEIYKRALATLRPNQNLLISTAPVGSALGAGLLWDWQRSKPALTLDPVRAAPLSGLPDYAARWRDKAERAFRDVRSNRPAASPTPH